MPRAISRLTLTVTDVRIQRVQEISEEDAQAEGVFCTKRGYWSADPDYAPLAGATAYGGSYCLWRHINGQAAWDANPWVVPLSFTVEKRNIDR